MLNMFPHSLLVSSCLLGFILGLLFTQRSGNYFVTMFDDYSATLPLVIVVVFETTSVAWVYGTDRWGNNDIKVLCMIMFHILHTQIMPIIVASWMTLKSCWNGALQWCINISGNTSVCWQWLDSWLLVCCEWSSKDPHTQLGIKLQ